MLNLKDLVGRSLRMGIKGIVIMLGGLVIAFVLIFFVFIKEQPEQQISKQEQTQQISDQPLIEQIKWGEITVKNNGNTITYRDVKLWPNHSREWNWKETGTRHNPDIQIADIQELIDKVDVVILTRGIDLVLQVPQETIDYAKQQGKEVHVGQTEDMVKLYNKLVEQGKKVGGVFHSTC